MKTAAAGEIVKIHKPSPDRAQPECPDYGRCGGCDFQHLTYPGGAVGQAPAGPGRPDPPGGRRHPGGGRSWGRRTPSTTATRASTPWARTAPSALPGPVPSGGAGEAVLDPARGGGQTAAAVGEWMRRYKVPAYDEATGKGLVRHVYVRVNRKGESLCCVVINGRQAPGSRSWPPMSAPPCPTPRGAGEQQHEAGQRDPGEKYRTLWGGTI